MKKCPKCNILKETFDFNRNEKNKDKLQVYCRECHLNIRINLKLRTNIVIPKNKFCWNCKCVKDSIYFSSNKKNLDGLHSECMECTNLLRRTKYKEKILESNRVYYKNNEEFRKRMATKSSEYRFLHRIILKRKRKIYYQNNKFRLKDNFRKNSQKWKSKNKDKLRMYARKRRDKVLKYDCLFSIIHEKIIFYIFKNKCFNCDRIDHLSIDHHFPLNNGNSLSIKNAVVLCIYCNSSKGIKLPDNFYTKDQLKTINILLNRAEKIFNRINKNITNTNYGFVEA